MANFNKVLLMGNLTRDPEMRYSEGQTAITKFGLATNRQWRDNSGEQREDVCFVDIVVFGRQAETCNEYLSKGRPVFIEGRLSFSSWEDRETGAKRSKLEVVAERVQFLGGRDDDDGPHDHRASRGGGQRQQPRRDEGHQRRDDRHDGQDRPPQGGSHGYDFDDIPFMWLLPFLGLLAHGVPLIA